MISARQILETILTMKSAMPPGDESTLKKPNRLEEDLRFVAVAMASLRSAA
jgi:hypothetical protein